MLKTALGSLILSLIVFTLGRVGISGLPLELGRIGALLVLLSSTLAVAGQLIFGRHPDAL